jgi:anaerobic selenocysteine-containing dehydrogenase
VLDRERLQREGHVRLNLEEQLSDSGSQFSDFLPFATGKFGTASGKAELYSEDLKAQGLDPVAAFTPPEESRHGSQARQFPLELLARKADNFLNSTFCNLPVVQEMEEAGLLEMSAADARARRP